MDLYYVRMKLPAKVTLSCSPDPANRVPDPANHVPYSANRVPDAAK